MRRERVLGIIAVSIVILTLVGVLIGPGVVADPTDRGPVRPGAMTIADLTISPQEVGGEQVTLTVTSQLRHRGNPTPNVSVHYRATDSRTGLVETTQRVRVGNVSGERELSVPANLTVDRQGSYRIEVVVYQDGQRVEQGERTIAGLEALTPAYARTSVAFEARGDLPTISTSVQEAGPNRTRLQVSTWLTNKGTDTPDGLRVMLVARQADSNLVAARESVSVGSIAPGRTTTTDPAVSVPAEYNYYLDAILWNDGVIVDTVRGVVNLNPEERIAANTTTREVELRVSDFESAQEGRPEGRETETGPASGAGPGFGIGAAVAAVLVATVLGRRWAK